MSCIDKLHVPPCHLVAVNSIRRWLLASTTSILITIINSIWSLPSIQVDSHMLSQGQFTHRFHRCRANLTISIAKNTVTQVGEHLQLESIRIYLCGENKISATVKRADDPLEKPVEANNHLQTASRQFCFASRCTLLTIFGCVPSVQIELSPRKGRTETTCCCANQLETTFRLSKKVGEQ